MGDFKFMDQYKVKFLDHLKTRTEYTEPKNLYEPIRYILDLGGKRLRPILTLMTAELFGGDPDEAMDAALAIEMFHNFSLVHDDIMDDAPLRRGRTTVHEKWDLNTGILSGDAMLILAYQFFEGYPPETFKKLTSLFSKTAIEVCEGQQYDVDFETRDDVTIPEYLKMIEYKTSVLVAAAMKMGAIIANASDKDAEIIYDFGKQVGGDIMENKKTFLYLKALQAAPKQRREGLMHLYSIKPENPSTKVEAVKAIFMESGAVDLTKEEIKSHTQKAFDVLGQLTIAEANKQVLRKFGEALMERTV